jgi:tetratricopeptide (TPR) repeat protein
MQRISPLRVGHYVLLVVLISSVRPFFAVAENCEEPIGKMVSVQGTVEAKKADDTQWQPVKLNDALCPGDTIRVLDNSRAELALANQSVLRINENTTITLEGVDEDRTTLVDLLKGAALFFSRGTRNLKVKSRYAIFGVRGTEFFIRVEERQAFMSVFEGTVLAENQAGSLTVTSDQSTVVEAGRAPVLTVVARPRDAVQWALYYPPVLYWPPGETPVGMAGDARFLAYRASQMLSVGRVDEANADIDQALRIDPNFSDALALQSIIAVVQNDKETALGQAQKAVAADPQSATAQIALSYARQARFDLKGARASVEAAVTLDPGNAIAWARLADLQASFGELGKALEAAKKAESLAPDLALTQTVLGFAFLAQVDIDQSMAAFEKAITLDQAAPLPRLGLGLAKIRKGDLDEGGRQIEIAAGLDSGNSLIRSYLGKTYYEEKRTELDGREYATAKKLDPNDPTPWFYDAIRLQTVNRPVEALHNYQKAIDLNDNRAIYRSKLLLDSDLAARQSSLARIYNNLGFQQRALVEGWRSVNTDPSNFSAHRFLADSYAALPRHEIARVSELLQSQLLQPINITPIQPTLAESNLFLIGSQGPATAGFNTYNPLFNRNQAVLQADGLVGSNSTWGAEGIASGIYDKLSLSAGYTRFKTDGWRENADQNNDIANIFAQYELSYKTSIQAEYRYRDNQTGDIQSSFFMDDYSPNLREEAEIALVRLGFRHAFSPDLVLIGNFGYQDADLTFKDQLIIPELMMASLDFDSMFDQNAHSGELEYIFRSQILNLAGGVGYFYVDTEETSTQFQLNIPLFPSLSFQNKTEEGGRDHKNIYLYSYLNLLDNMTLTIGASGDFLNSSDNELLNKEQFNPKFGITWNLIKDTTLRGAVFRGLKRTLITNQTLEPTQVAGFNQFYSDDVSATDAWNYGIAFDQRFSVDLYGGAEFVYRDLKVPFMSFTEVGDSKKTEADWDEKRSRAYLFWTPHEWFSLTAEWLWERFDTDEFSVGVKDVETNSIPLGVNFFHPSGFYAALKGTYVNQKGSFDRQLDGLIEDGQDNFWLIDASIGYRLPKRYGFITIGVKNLFDKEFQYFDIDPENPRMQPGRFFFARLTLGFP